MGLSTFLMGLSDIPGFTDHNTRSHAKNQSVLPESFLRKDDVFYEDVKQLVEKCFGTCDTDIGQHIISHNMEFSDFHNVSRIVLTLLDDMSNNALYHIAKIVVEDSVSLDKTRPQLKKIIREGLLDTHSKKCDSYQVKIQSEICQLLKNPKNFRQNHVSHLHLTSKSHRGAIMNILDRLEEMSSQTLGAMYRKLRGVHGYVPQFCPPRPGWTRDRLIDQVRKLCLGTIHQLGDADELQKSVAKAMAVACLSFRIAGYQDLSAANFVHVTPELEALQNEIVKAIWSLGRRTKKEEIKILQRILDPESKVDGKGLKTSIKNMLIEFLFESIDMNAIPDSLLEAVSVINKTPRNPRKFFSKDIIEEEVECILNMSAHLKQILWDYVPGDKLDQDFANAYMEELEESDDGDIFDDEDDELQLCTDALYKFHSRFNDFTEEVQSTGEPELASFKLQGGPENTNESSCSSSGATIFSDDVECPNTGTGGGGMIVSASSESSPSPLGSPMPSDSGVIVGRQDLKGSDSVDSVKAAAGRYSTVSCPKQIPVPESQNITINQYVTLQEVCDQASVVAYQLIGHVLKGFGQMESLNLDWDDESYLCGECSPLEFCQDPVANTMDKTVGGAIIVQAVHKVIPSFSSSDQETLKKLLNL